MKEKIAWLVTRIFNAGVADDPEELHKAECELLALLDSEPVGEVWLKGLAKNLREQDNLATANPIFAVQQNARTYGFDTDYSDNVVWIDGEGNEADEDMVEYLESGHEPNDWTRTAYVDNWEFVQPFFTQAAAAAFIQANDHNLNEARVYVYSGYRNHEWEQVRKYLLTPQPAKEVVAWLVLDRNGHPFMSHLGKMEAEAGVEKWPERSIRPLTYLTPEPTEVVEGIEGVAFLDGDSFCPDCDGQKSYIFVPNCEHDSEVGDGEVKATLILTPEPGEQEGE